jgi:hypothetical protein
MMLMGCRSAAAEFISSPFKIPGGVASRDDLFGRGVDVLVPTSAGPTQIIGPSKGSGDLREIRHALVRDDCGGMGYMNPVLGRRHNVSELGTEHAED